MLALGHIGEAIAIHYHPVEEIRQHPSRQQSSDTALITRACRSDISIPLKPRIDDCKQFFIES